MTNHNQKPAPRGAPALTVAELVELTYAARWSGQRSEDTSLANGRDLAGIIGPERRASGLRQTDVDRVRVELRRRGLKPGTINRKLAALSAMLRTARSHGITLPELELHRERDGQGRIRTLSEAEEAAILDAFRSLPLRGRTDDALEAARLAEFLLCVGCRVSEALGATWRHLELRDGRRWLALAETKNGSARTIPLPRRAADLLFRLGEDLDAPLFSIGYKRFHYLFERARERAGIDDKTLVPHCLRHTCLTRLVRRGVDPARVQRWAGHKRIETTLLYVHLTGNDLESIADLE